jgi:hypothetical protein
MKIFSGFWVAFDPSQTADLLHVARLRRFVTTYDALAGMENFTVRPLDRSQLHVAFPLIRHAAPSVDLQEWCRFARRATNPRSATKRGVIVAYRADLPHPSGLFCYVREPDLLHGATLTATYFIVLDMFNPGAVSQALIDALESLGRRLKCGLVRCAPIGNAAEGTTCFFAAGHRLEGAFFSKPVDRPSLN